MEVDLFGIKFGGKKKEKKEPTIVREYSYTTQELAKALGVKGTIVWIAADKYGIKVKTKKREGMEDDEWD